MGCYLSHTHAESVWVVGLAVSNGNRTAFVYVKGATMDVIYPSIRKHNAQVYSIGRLIVYVPPSLRHRNSFEARVSYIHKHYHDYILSKIGGKHGA